MKGGGFTKAVNRRLTGIQYISCSHPPKGHKKYRNIYRGGKPLFTF